MVVGMYVEKFASYTTMHGFPRIVASKATPKRLAWIIVFTTAWLFFIFHSSYVLSSYFQYPKKTTTEIMSGGVPFPEITLCSLGSFDFYTVYRLNKGLEALDKEKHKKEDKKDDYHNYSRAHDVLDLNWILALNDIVTEGYDTDSYINDTFIRAMYRYYDLLNNTNINDSYYKVLYDKLFSRTTLAATMPYKMLSANGVREKEFIVKCTFKNEPCKFTRIFDPYFFNCFTFKPPNDTRNSSGQPPLLEGIDNGFSVILLAGTRMLEEENITDLNFLRLPGIYAGDNHMSGAGGVRVVIHPPGTKPYPMTEGYDVLPERMASLGINLEKQKRLSQPYGHCCKEYPEGLHLAGTYSRKTCEKVCIQHLGIAHECQCFENTLPTRWEVKQDADIRKFYDKCLSRNNSDGHKYLERVCLLLDKCSGTAEFQQCFAVNSDDPPKCDTKILTDLVDKMNCAENAKNRLMANETFLSTECGCHPACNNTKYVVSYSLSQWPSHGVDGKTVAHEIMNDLNFTGWFTPEEKRKFYDDYRQKDLKKAMKDFSKINVYISDSDVFQTTEEPAITVTELISDMGGQLGVWIGVSVLTLAEVLEILISMVIDCCRKRFAKHNIDNKAETELKDATVGDVTVGDV